MSIAVWHLAAYDPSTNIQPSSNTNKQEEKIEAHSS
jgi:hypothetical protein